VRAAEASCAERCLERINAKAEQGSIFCDTWLLERRYPADFGARQHITSDNKNDNNNTNTNVSVDATEEARSSILSKLSPKSTKE
jgi:hypothetical protein